MPVVDKCFYKLENEFSDIYVEIKIGEKSFGDGDSAEFEHPEDAPTIYEFNLIFQHDYTCHWANYKPDIEYHKYLEKIRLDFYREINDEIDYSGDKFEILNLLDDYLLRSTQLKEYYFDKDVSSGRVKTQVKSHKLIQYHYSNDKPISKSSVAHILNPYFTIQIEVLDKIINMLESKISLIKDTEDSVQPKHRSPYGKRKIQPIEKLDLYQSALLFFYLNESGAINYSSSRQISPLVAELTGHSEQNLRTEAFSKIVDVKRGQSGNKPKLAQNASHNLIAVNEVVINMLRNIKIDIDKNKKK